MTFKEWYEDTYKESWHEDYAELRTGYIAFMFWAILTGINFALLLEAISDNSIIRTGVAFATLTIAIINLNIIIKKVNK